jgi:23S rRNA pseudouridine1911/1915/1917 synthase
MNMNIIHEDSDLLVIQKPSGVIVNRAGTTKNMVTVQDWAENYIGIAYRESHHEYGEIGWTPEEDFYQRGGIVHRLDKETSGVLLVAKTPSAFVSLQKQFRERTVKKTYSALAHGVIPSRDGTIDAPLGRLPWNRTRFGVLSDGREAVTQYHVVRYYQQGSTIFTFLELYPQSGRTHQIRVHLQHIHHPIFADELYAGRKTARTERKLLQRVFLHASKISFKHPETRKTMTYEAALPQELEDLLTKMAIIEV